LIIYAFPFFSSSFFKSFDMHELLLLLPLLLHLRPGACCLLLAA